MKNTFLITLISISSLFLTGCGSFKNKLGRSVEALSSGNYTVTVWSGDKAVKTYNVVNGFVNTEQGTDGWFFFIDEKLIRVSGTVTVEQQ